MNRRRSLSILAGAATAGLSGCRRPQTAVSRWQGVMFNADVNLAIHGLDPKFAQDLTERCVVEMSRLEKIFTLYDPASDLCRLNETGRLENPASDFVALVDEALAIAERTGGRFDPTVQPYWVWLRETVESGRLVTEQRRRRELAKVDYRKVRSSPGLVCYDERGMAMTLNGIAQGWITDRICEMLRAGGASHTLVNLGEFFGVGSSPAGGPWQVAIREAEAEPVALQDRALAVSSGAGLFFGTGAGRNHLINPHTGSCAEDRRVVAVTAPRASTADALSTACAVLPDEEARDLIRQWDAADLRIIRGA